MSDLTSTTDLTTSAPEIKSFNDLRWCLAIVAHVVLPLAAGALIFAKIRWGFELSWPALLVVGVGLLPFLVPFAAAYFKKLPGGLEPRSLQGSAKDLLSDDAKPKPTPPAKEPEVTTPPPTPTAVTPTVRHLQLSYPRPATLPKVALKTLATLWRYQKQSNEWWGFTIRIGGTMTNPEEPEFAYAVNALSQLGLVYRDPRGLVFLTVAGKLYCEANRDDLGDDTWSGFKPA